MTTIITNQNIYIQDIGSGIKYKIGSTGSYNTLSFPCTVNNINAPTNITVFISTNLTFNNSNQYFICSSSNIIFDGAQYIITLDGISNYPGLIKNGTILFPPYPNPPILTPGYNDITVQGFNISCINGSGLSGEAGYVCQFGFAVSALNNIVQNCSSDGIIQGVGVGGICGSYAAYSTGNLTISNCSSTGDISSINYSGGICGSDAGSGVYGSGINGTVNITNCYSTGFIGSAYGGGICGFYAGNVNITNCYSTGTIGVNISPNNGYNTGGIVGGYPAYNGGHTIVSNCFSLGSIGSVFTNAAGIVGPLASPGGILDIINCYSLGDIFSSCSGICGSSGTNTNITNCYSLGNIADNAFGICYGMDGSYTSSAIMNITNCYSIGNIGANSAGICYGISGGPPSTIQTLNVYNCYTIGTVDPTGAGLVLNPIPPTGGIINITNSLASGTGIWSDITANTYLTGTPVSGTPIVLGPVWNSITTDTPYLLASFDNNIYNPSTETTNNLVGGIYTGSPGVFQDPGVLYALVNNTDTQITIDSNNGEVTFNLGVSAMYGTYSTNVFVSYNLGGFYYYGYNFNSFTLIYESPPIPPTPISDICFPENTPVKVDQGIIPIQKINPLIHTINNKKIVAITKTISKDDYLVCFEKNSLKLNYPTARTIISKNHKIFYGGKMIEADYFAKRFAFIERIKYNGEFLYNVLMESHERISVNNMLCETINPKNPIALLYNKNIDNISKNKITEIINSRCLKKERERELPKKITRMYKMSFNF
jgi:hypothetical protein